MTSVEPLRVMIADDHSILRVGLKQILEQAGEFEVVGQAADGEEAIKVAEEVLPDVIVMDVMMPKKDGVSACREIMETLPETHVVMLTASTEEDAVVEAVAAGATGYLQKETGRDRLLSVVRDVMVGELRVPAGAIARAFAEVRAGTKTTDFADDARLTKREREILVAFSTGKSYARIAEERGIKPVTVRNAVYGIQNKLNVGSMQELVLWSVRNGLLDDYVTDAKSPSQQS